MFVGPKSRGKFASRRELPFLTVWRQCKLSSDRDITLRAGCGESPLASPAGCHHHRPGGPGESPVPPAVLHLPLLCCCRTIGILSAHSPSRSLCWQLCSGRGRVEQTGSAPSCLHCCSGLADCAHIPPPAPHTWARPPGSPGEALAGKSPLLASLPSWGLQQQLYLFTGCDTALCLQTGAAAVG